MYAFSIRLGGPFTAVVPRVIEVLKEEGFDVLRSIDADVAAKTMLNIEGRPYCILSACSYSPLAHQAITADPDIGVLLPCNVVVREEASAKVTVSFLDPTASLRLAGKGIAEDLAAELRVRMERVMKALS